MSHLEVAIIYFVIKRTVRVPAWKLILNLVLLKRIRNYVMFYEIDDEFCKKGFTVSEVRAAISNIQCLAKCIQDFHEFCPTEKRDVNLWGCLFVTEDLRKLL